MSIDPPLPETNHPSTLPYVNQFLVAARWPMAFLTRLWTRGAFGEDGFITELTNRPSDDVDTVHHQWCLPSPPVSHLLSVPRHTTQGAVGEDVVTMVGSALGSFTDNPVAVDQQFVMSVDTLLSVAENSHPTPTSSTTNLPSSSLVDAFNILIQNLAARLPMESLHRLWTLGEDTVITPGSALSFITGGLFSFIQIKAQGQTGFPFMTHPHAIMVAFTSLIIFGFSYVAEHLSASRYGATIARFGKLGSAYIMAASLASLFYL